MNLTINESDDEIENVAACDSYLFDGNTLMTSGQYKGQFTNFQGCDSLVTLNLTILESYDVEEDAEICGFYVFNNMDLFESGVYQEVFEASNGCDSLVTLNLTILESTEGSADIEACDSYDWEGTTYTTSGSYMENLTNSVGCDSVATLNLTILDSDETVEDIEACGFYVFDSKDIFSSGSYEGIFENSSGCDSLVTLNLTILEEPSAEVFMNGIVLFAEDETATSYQWIDCDTNEPLVGETKRQLTPPGVGSYAVEVSNGSCTVISGCYESNLVLSTPEIPDNSVNIYPTITSGLVTLDFNGRKENVDIWITSLNGKTISHQHYSSMISQEIAIAGPTGLYIVQVAIDNKLYSTQRIIKTQ